MTHRSRGSILVAVLLLSVILLLMGMAMVAVSGREYDEGLSVRYATQARILAESGIEDAVQKLARGLDFPPLPGGTVLPDAGAGMPEGAQVFAYSQELPTVGVYRVEIDTSRATRRPEEDPGVSATYDYLEPGPGGTMVPRNNYTVLISSVGLVHGPNHRAERPEIVARRTIRAELDVSPRERGKPVHSRYIQPGYYTDPADFYTNPSYFKLLRWEDSGTS